MADALDFCWLGNELCLDFHNTTTWSGASPLTEGERLTGFRRLVDWCEAAGILASADASRYRRGSDASHAADLHQAIELRRVLHNVFGAVATAATPSKSDVQALNDYLASVVMRVSWEGSDQPVMASDATGDLHELLSPVVWSAASLLVSPYRDRIGRCANPACGWVYVDLSRRGNRRWCDMATCGNREKARRHHQREAM